MDGKHKSSGTLKKTKNTAETGVEVGCTVIQTSALFISARLEPSVTTEVSVSEGSTASPARLGNKQEVWSLTLRPVC